MKTVYVANPAASHGAFAPASAVFRGSTARKSNTLNVATLRTL